MDEDGTVHDNSAHGVGTAKEVVWDARNMTKLISKININILKVYSSCFHFLLF